MCSKAQSLELDPEITNLKSVLASDSGLESSGWGGGAVTGSGSSTVLLWVGARVQQAGQGHTARLSCIGQDFQISAGHPDRYRICHWLSPEMTAPLIWNTASFARFWHNFLGTQLGSLYTEENLSVAKYFGGKKTTLSIAVVPQMWSLDQQHQPQLRAY